MKLGLTMFNSFFCMERILDLGRNPKFILFIGRCVFATRLVFFTVTPSGALQLTSDEFLITLLMS